MKLNKMKTELKTEMILLYCKTNYVTSNKVGLFIFNANLQLQNNTVE